MYTYGMYTYGMYTYGMYTYGMYTYGMYTYGMYTYGMYTYGMYLLTIASFRIGVPSILFESFFCSTQLIQTKKKDKKNDSSCFEELQGQ
jgi:hypothetical protein